jgi:glycosyltransferase involved in cell wall biosynthesis
VKILYYSSHPHINMAAPSGPGTHIREVINGFEENGHTVVKYIVGGTELKEQSGQIIYKNRSWKKLIPNFLWQTLKDLNLIKLDRQLEKSLIEIIHKEKPDLIYERAYYLMGSGYRAAMKTGVKYFVEMNAPYPEEKKDMNGASLFGAMAEKNERKQVTASHKTFVVSSALKNYLLKKNNDLADKIIVTPNAVNPEHIHVSEESRKKLAAELKIKHDDIVLGFVGSIFPYHGVDALIDVFAKLKSERKENLKLLVVGDGEILSELKERTKMLKIDNLVTFTGNIAHSKVYTYISLMDITIMARSNWYGSPVKIFEYGIMKKCIVAPDVVPVQDVMINREDGLLVKDNVDDLMKALQYLLDHPHEMEKYASNFYNKVINQHTWQKVSETIISQSI